MKWRTLFSGENKKIIIGLLFAEFARKLVLDRHLNCILFTIKNVLRTWIQGMVCVYILIQNGGVPQWLVSMSLKILNV